MSLGDKHYCDPILQSRKLRHWVIRLSAQDPTVVGDRAEISAG